MTRISRNFRIGSSSGNVMESICANRNIRSDWCIYTKIWKSAVKSKRRCVLPCRRLVCLCCGRFLCPGQLTVDGIATLVTNCGITDFCSESAEGWGALVQRVFFNDWFVVDFTVVFQEPLKNKDRRKQKSFADLYFYQYRLWPKNWFCQSYGTYDSSGNWATYDSYAIETCID